MGVSGRTSSPRPPAAEAKASTATPKIASAPEGLSGRALRRWRNNQRRSLGRTTRTEAAAETTAAAEGSGAAAVLVPRSDRPSAWRPPRAPTPAPRDAARQVNFAGEADRIRYDERAPVADLRDQRGTPRPKAPRSPPRRRTPPRQTFPRRRDRTPQRR